MSAAVDPHAEVAHAEHGHGEHATPSNAYYWRIALALAIITGLEVLLTYLHIGKLFLPVLLILMVIKFLTVVFEFMHLRLDSKVFKYLFYSGLLLAVGVYIVALSTFQFFAK